MHSRRASSVAGAAIACSGAGRPEGATDEPSIDDLPSELTVTSSVSESTFIGVDLAWAINKNPTAVAVLAGDETGAELVGISGPLISHTAVVEYVAARASGTAVVAIDASLVVTNATGQRPCEKLIGHRFGGFGASCHSTNLGKRYARTGMDLVAELQHHGFAHDLDLASAQRRSGRWLFEVYPHPAMVQLWGLEWILSYKKGRVAEKRTGLRVLQEHLWRLTRPEFGLRQNSMLTEVLSRDLLALRGQALKNYEDSLDALFCAYLAWHCWRFGGERNEMIGTLEDGYIVVPRRSATASA